MDAGAERLEYSIRGSVDDLEKIFVHYIKLAVPGLGTDSFAEIKSTFDAHADALVELVTRKP